MKTNKKTSILGAAVKGAIVGGLAVAGAMALADKENREKIKKSFVATKGKAMGMMEDLKGKARDKKEEIVDKAEDVQKIVKGAAEDIQDAD